LPFLRLTRDRRGTENTFLLHADRPGDRPRLLYWYRTAPGIALGRSPLDEDAIRTIEEQHPDIDFDWPAILALSEVMTPEDEAPAARPQPKPSRKQRPPRGGREGGFSTEASRQPRRDEHADESPAAPEPGDDGGEAAEFEADTEPAEAMVEEAPRRASGLLEELVGREIAMKLRARYSEIMTRIHEQDSDAASRDAWAKRAESLNPDLWLTPDAILEGVRGADQIFDRLRAELALPKS
jgi:hypothetical protein